MAAADGTLRLWEVARLEPVALVPADVCASGSLSVVRPDADSLYVARADGTTLTVPLADAAPLPDGHQGSVWSLSQHPAGQVLASGSSDGTVRVWDTRTGVTRQVLSGHEGWVNSVAFDPMGQVLASGSSDGTVRVWDTRTGVTRQVLTGHRGGGVTSIGWEPEPVGLVSTGYDGTVLRWCGTRPITLGTHDRRVWMVTASRGSDLVATTGADRTLRIWRVGDAAEPVLTIPLPDVGTACHLAPAGRDEHVLAYSVRGGSVVSASLRVVTS